MTQFNLNQAVFGALIAAAVSTLAPTVADAAPPRTVFVYDGGAMKNVAGDHWVERNLDGVFHFREVARNFDFVEMYDASRDCTVRVYATAFYVRSGSDPFQQFYTGRWLD